MRDDATTVVPQETGALMDHTLRRYHEMLRTAPSAARVEQVLATDPEVSVGLAHPCGSWRLLFGGTATLLDGLATHIDGLATHIALENELLFSRLESAA